MKNRSYHFYAMITIISWALAFVLTKIGMEHYSCWGLSFWRYWFSVFVVIILIAVYKISKPAKEDIKWFLLSGLLGFALYTVLFSTGTALVTATTSSLVIATSPVMTAMVGAIFCKERLKVYQWVAIAVEFFGIGVLTMYNGVLSVNVGIVWLLAAAFSFCLFNFSQRKILRKYPPMSVALFSLSAAAVWLLPFTETAVAEISTATWQLVAILILLAVVSSVIANLSWAKALRIAEKTTNVTNYMFVTPIVTAVLGFAMIGEIPDFATVFGGIIVILGMLLFNRENIKAALGK